MKRRIASTALSLALALSASAQYTLADWEIKDFNPSSELNLNGNEYKLDGNLPLVYADCVQPEQMAYSTAESIQG